MTILLFGVSNVGKTAIGEKLVQCLGYVFYDLDEEVKKYYISEIKKDIVSYKRSFSKVKNKFHINNDSVETVVERIIKEYNLAK